jgi:8-oxo-dGTP pyrophosphatase MutT (NUDIX family)
VTGERLTRDAIIGRLAAAAGRIRGDHELNPDLLPEGALVPAAVLVPIVDRPQGMTILLTQRTDHLSDHAGQISFPGGRIEPQDRHPEAAALREAREEVGLEAARVALVGRLDVYVTRTGFRVVPVVGIVDPRFTLCLDPFEVADAFEVPLAFVVDPTNHGRHSRHFAGSQRQFYALAYRNRYIWGATAGMLVNLAQVLGRPTPA